MSVLFSVPLRLLGLFLLVMLAAVSARASMQVYPTLIQFEADEPTETVTIKNKKKEPLTVQISPRIWRQGDEGEDRYEETDELLVFPRMAIIDPGGKQIVRLRYRGEPSEVERAFRLLVEEVAVPDPGKAVMRFVITMSVPVFVLPQDEAYDISIENAVLKRGAVHVSLKNSGTVHEQAASIRYQIFDGKQNVLTEGEGSGWYILSGRRRTFQVNVPEGPCRKAVRIALEVALKGEERMPLTGETKITNPADCKRPPKPEKTLPSE